MSVSMSILSNWKYNQFDPSSFIFQEEQIQYQYNFKHGTIIRTGITCKKIPL